MAREKNGSIGVKEAEHDRKRTTAALDEKQKIQRARDDFVAPDGGWGWMIVLATGFSNFCILPLLQSFGLIFRDKFNQLGINSSETTTILNINCAITSCIGLANGPLFRKYSYRQVSFVGALICAMSLTVLSTMKTFAGMLFFFSILYGAGVGITMSANALALNTYFKEKRRIATGFSWTCTGMGPIVMPQIITQLIPIFGMEGTVLIYAGFAFNAVACALLLQPVSWHTRKKRTPKKLEETKEGIYRELSTDETIVGNGTPTAVLSPNAVQSRSLENVAQNGKLTDGSSRRAKQIFGSQYLYYDDEEDGATGIDVMGPGTPMMSRANDGWFSKKSTSNASLTSRSSKKDNAQKTPSRRQSMSLSRQTSSIALSRGSSARNLSRQSSETERRRKISALQPSAVPLIIVSESCEHVDTKECNAANCGQRGEIKPAPNEIDPNELMKRMCEESEASAITNIDREAPKSSHTFLNALVIFFDLDLLRDLVYVNLMLGITFANFTELNFSLLTPFILGEYGFSKIEVATVMSILAGVDVVMRITIPFVSSLVDWENRTFFLVGVCSMALGRIVLAHVRDFGVTVAIAVLIGAGKAFRTIFVALVIPTHVPLSRLPAATGLQLLTSGVVFMALGPVIGWIRDVSGDYATMLHVLNVFTYLTAISWLLEVSIAKWTARKTARANEEAKQRLNG